MLRQTVYLDYSSGQSHQKPLSLVIIDTQVEIIYVGTLEYRAMTETRNNYLSTDFLSTWSSEKFLQSELTKSPIYLVGKNFDPVPS